MPVPPQLNRKILSGGTDIFTHVTTLSKDCTSVLQELLRKNYCPINVRRHWASFLSPPSWKGTVPSLFTALHSVTHTLRPLARTAWPQLHDFWDSALRYEIQPQGSWAVLSWAFAYCCTSTEENESAIAETHQASAVALTSSRASFSWRYVLSWEILNPHRIL